MGNRSADTEDDTVPRSEPYFQAIFNDPHVLMAILGPEGKIRHVNRAALELVNPAESDIVGTPFWEGPWWEHSQRVRDEFRWRVSRAAAGEYVEFETDYITGGDEQRLTAGFLRPVTDDTGTVVSIIASGRDITDQVYQQQQLEVLQRILRHNFRNGLNLIQGYAEEIRSTDDEGDVEAMARAIAEQATDLAESVSKIQQLEQRDPGFRETITVESLFTQIIDRAREQHPDCCITSTVPRSDVEVPEAFRIAISEAIDNAIEHHPQSAPTVELTATIVDDAEPPQVRLCIADDGPGIPPAESDPVLAGEETALTHSSGVGLWLIKWIVEQHGGNISIPSSDSQGGRITLTYPFVTY